MEKNICIHVKKNIWDILKYLYWAERLGGVSLKLEGIEGADGPTDRPLRQKQETEPNFARRLQNVFVFGSAVMLPVLAQL